MCNYYKAVSLMVYSASASASRKNNQAFRNTSMLVLSADNDSGLRSTFERPKLEVLIKRKILAPLVYLFS